MSQVLDKNVRIELAEVAISPRIEFDSIYQAKVTVGRKRFIIGAPTERQRQELLGGVLASQVVPSNRP